MGAGTPVLDWVLAWLCSDWQERASGLVLRDVSQGEIESSQGKGPIWLDRDSASGRSGGRKGSCNLST